MNEINKPTKRLYRSRKNRMLAGVCAGLADYLNTDPTWVRLFFVLFFFLGGIIVLPYLVMWFIVPLSPVE